MRNAGGDRARCSEPRWDAACPARGSPGAHGRRGGREDGREASGATAEACSQIPLRGRRHLRENEGDIRGLDYPEREGWIGLDEIIEVFVTGLNWIKQDNRYQYHRIR